MKNLTVLHVDTERGWRGGERQLFWLARELADRGHRCLVAARLGEPLAERAAEAGLLVVPCSPRSELDLGAARRLRGVIEREGIDLVHAHTAHAVALSALATVGGRGVPVVAARRVDFPLRRGIGTRLKYGRMKALIAVSGAVERILEKSGVDPARVVIVPDGTDIHRNTTPANRAILDSLGVPPMAPLVVQVAQLVGHKDPLTFVRAIEVLRSLLPDAHALLVGDGPLRASVDDAVRARGLSDRLHVVGYRTDADRLLAAADVVCLSSSEEGMGSVLLDALVFGRPVAATMAGGIPEVVVNGVTGLLVPVGDSNALGEVIARLLSDATLRRRMGVAAHDRAERFSVERMTDRTLNVYARVLGLPVDEESADSSASSILAP